MKKVDLKVGKKIESPLAKYNAAGQLFCVLCNQPVKNEMVWIGHVNGRAHRDNLQLLKSKKRPQEPNQLDTDIPPSKKLAIEPSPNKSNNSVYRKSGDTNTFKTPFPVTVTSSSVSSTDIVLSPVVDKASRNIDVDLSLIRDSKQIIVSGDDDSSSIMEIEETKNSSNTSKPNGIGLPEGFFDDPKLDAKARGVEWRNPDEIEWENFLKEIASEEAKSSTLRVVDEEESTVTRELDEIEEQMTHWQRVLDLERKAEEVKKQKLMQIDKTILVDSDEDIDELYDEELNWRSKKH